MKRDLQINYGELENIIEQLHTYKRSLEKMRTSLADIKGFVQHNQGKSIDAWMEKMSDSKVKMDDYETQISDLLNLFEGYVSDTTSYISPVSRRVMMRVDRNDIWMNLKQIESGMDGNVGKALMRAHQSPASLLRMLSDPTETKQEASRHNQGQMDYIQQQVEQTRNRLEYKMDELWDLYHSKVVKFENVDDAYNDKAGAVKDKYTNLFESFWDGVEDIAQGVSDLVSGVNNSLKALVMGVLSVAADIGVVVSSGTIPNPIEPDWLQQKADSTVDGYTQSLKQTVKDPMSVVETVGQSVSDTVDEKGIAYVTGAALPSLVPATWALKGVRGASALGKMSGASKLNNADVHTNQGTKNGIVEAEKESFINLMDPDDAERYQQYLDKLEVGMDVKARVATGEMSPNSFVNKILSQKLKEHNLSYDEFTGLRLKPGHELNSSQREIMQDIRDSVPRPNKDTMLIKNFHEKDIQKYLDGTYTSTKGFITKSDDASYIHDYSHVRESMRLDYSYYDEYAKEVVQPFSEHGNSYGYIEFKAEDSVSISPKYLETPYGPDFEKPYSGWERNEWPWTGNGFTSSRNSEVVPEWTLNRYIDFNVGAKLHKVVDGEDEVIAIFNDGIFKRQ